MYLEIHFIYLNYIASYNHQGQEDSNAKPMYALLCKRNLLKCGILGFFCLIDLEILSQAIYAVAYDKSLSMSKVIIVLPLVFKAVRIKTKKPGKRRILSKHWGKPGKVREN